MCTGSQKSRPRRSAEVRSLVARDGEARLCWLLEQKFIYWGNECALLLLAPPPSSLQYLRHRLRRLSRSRWGDPRIMRDAFALAAPLSSEFLNSPSIPSQQAPHIHTCGPSWLGNEQSHYYVSRVNLSSTHLLLSIREEGWLRRAALLYTHTLGVSESNRKSKPKKNTKYIGSKRFCS